MLSGKNENGINYYTARKLKDMAQSLEQLAKAFDEGAGETMSLTKDDGLAAMQTCAALVCGNCGGCSLYADSEKEDSCLVTYSFSASSSWDRPFFVRSSNITSFVSIKITTL